MLLGRGAWVLPSRMEWTFTTARGPGGQHVNKSSTAAVLRVALDAIGGLHPDARDRLVAQAGSALVGGSELLFRCDMHRSQLQNRTACQARLAALVAHAAIRHKVRKKTKPSKGSIQRRLDSKKADAAKKQRRQWRGE